MLEYDEIFEKIDEHIADMSIETAIATLRDMKSDIDVRLEGLYADVRRRNEAEGL